MIASHFPIAAVIVPATVARVSPIGILESILGQNASVVATFATVTGSEDSSIEFIATLMSTQAPAIATTQPALAVYGPASRTIESTFRINGEMMIERDTATAPNATVLTFY